MEFSDSDIGEFAFSHYSVKSHTAESTQLFLTLLQLTFYNLQFLLHNHSSSRSGRKFTYKTKNLQKNLQNSKTLFFSNDPLDALYYNIVFQYVLYYNIVSQYIL